MNTKLTELSTQLRALSSEFERALTEAQADPYAELKAAHAAGKTIQAQHVENGPWCDLKHVYWQYPPSRYRIKPWTLPDPPAGQQWHRRDFTSDMLPEGWRPLLKSEFDNKQHGDIERARPYGDIVKFEKLTNSSWYADPTEITTHFFRTKRPLPAPVAPAEPRVVPLEACDVPPGSAVKWRDTRLTFPDKGPSDWTLILGADADGIVTASQVGDGPHYLEKTSWAELADHLIKRPGDHEWSPASKPSGAQQTE